MADPICRWRNSTPKTVCEFVEELPKEEMSSAEFRKKMSTSKYGDAFFHTPYQLACQLGLYYEDSTTDKYIPRFNRSITEEEALEYLKLWISRYYIPNPYIKRSSFQNIEPKPFLWSLVAFIEENSGRCDIHDACEQVFKEAIGNKDIIVNALNNYSEIIKIDKNGMAELVDNYKDIMERKIDRNDKKTFFETFNKSLAIINNNKHISNSIKKLLTALRTKPFVLLAGISGTGKSRIVRELAKACWPQDNKERKEHKPRNYEMVQVRPNWHDSSELLGYVSRIGGEPQFVAGDLLKFVVRAWEEPSVPYFLCLDEMNLAPVEQYFAEFLSVIETRKLENGTIVTDPLLKAEKRKEQNGEIRCVDWYENLIKFLLAECPDDKIFALQKQFEEQGIAIPQNLFVVGTVNMDETTFSFSRKVLDRAMTIEMNEVNLHGGLGEDATSSEFGYIDNTIIPQVVEGKDVYIGENKELCDEVLKYLEKVNEALDGTPFKIAYRTRNEFLVYAVIRGAESLTAALDEMTSMKILSRIEGDSERTKTPLEALEKIVNEHINIPDDGKEKAKSISAAKIAEMLKKLESSGYTSFWS